MAGEIVQAGKDYEQALMGAIQRGEADEDRSHGHALSRDPALRAVQKTFVGYAARHLGELRHVLRNVSMTLRHRGNAI